MARPPKYAYKGIIIHTMVKEQIKFSYERNIGKYRYAPIFLWDIKYEPLYHTPTKLYHTIDLVTKKMNWPTMSWTTLIKYLREMVADQILISPHGNRKYNEKPYRLSERKLATYLSYIFFRRGLIVGLFSRIQSETSFGRKPFSGLLLVHLYVEVLRTERTSPFPFL